MRTSTVRIDGLKDIIAIDASEYGHAVTLDKNGCVYTWGRNDLGQIGDGTTEDRLTPYLVNIPPAKAVSAGYKQTFAIDINGTMWAWGADSVNQLGDGGYSTNYQVEVYRTSPILVDSSGTPPTMQTSPIATQTPDKPQNCQ